MSLIRAIALLLGQVTQGMSNAAVPERTFENSRLAWHSFIPFSHSVIYSWPDEFVFPVMTQDLTNRAHYMYITFYRLINTWMLYLCEFPVHVVEYYMLNGCNEC